MSVRTLRLFILSVCSTLLLVLAVGGCSRCGSACTPQGPWQSPTIQATRALLVVNTEELRILRMDGRNVHPSCIGTDGVRGQANTWPMTAELALKLGAAAAIRSSSRPASRPAFGLTA